VRSSSGETWNFYLDARTMLPCMVVATDSSGDLIERDVYHEIRENPAELTAIAAFDPARRWGSSQGFLSRLARTATGTSDSNNSRTATR
jgi:hypothetical protein